MGGPSHKPIFWYKSALVICLLLLGSATSTHAQCVNIAGVWNGTVNTFSLQLIVAQSSCAISGTMTTSGTSFFSGPFSGSVTGSGITFQRSGPFVNCTTGAMDIPAQNYTGIISSNGLVMSGTFVHPTCGGGNWTVSRPPPPTPTITTPSLNNGTVNSAYSQNMAASGGTRPYTWSAVGLAPGLSINPSSGLISGTPTSAGMFPATITVTDQALAMSSTQFRLTVNPGTPLSITTTSPLPSGTVGTAYTLPTGGSITLTATGGTPPYTWSIASGSGALPDGLALSPSSGAITAITGTPTTAGTFNFTVQVTDSVGSTFPKPLSIQIGPIPPPTNLSAVQCGTTGVQCGTPAITGAAIHLTWDYGTNPIDGFHIYRKTISAQTWSMTPIATLTNAVTPYSVDDQLPDPDATFMYRVTAFTGAFESAPSNESTIFQLQFLTAECAYDTAGNRTCGPNLPLAPGQLGFNTIIVSFMPKFPISLEAVINAELAANLNMNVNGSYHFNWVSNVIHDNTGQFFDFSGMLLNPNGLPYLDPPIGGYFYKISPNGTRKNMNTPADSLEYYWDEAPGFDSRKFIFSTYAGGDQSTSPLALFQDDPFDSDLVPGDYIGFLTTLVAVPSPIGSVVQPIPLAHFTWSTTNNGSTGGVGLRSNLDPPTTPGTGGIFNAQIVRSEDLPLNVRLALIQEGVQSVSIAPKIDKDAPMTAAFLSGQQGTNGWYTDPVTTTLITTDIDGPSDIVGTAYSVDAGSSTAYAGSFTVSGDGSHTIQFGSVDLAGNVETPKSITLKIDKTPPVITTSASPSVLWPPNGKMVNVTVSGMMADSLSGVNSTTAIFAVKDAYGLVQPAGLVNLASNGTYSFTISLKARRDGQDKNGRVYTILVGARDNAGNPSLSTTTVIVPHDQRN